MGQRTLDAEVEQHRRSVGSEHHVLRAQVAVQQSACVEAAERGAQIPSDLRDPPRGQRASGGGQGLSLDERQRDAEFVVALLDPPEADDVGVLDGRERARLTQEVLADRRGVRRPCVHLQRDLPVEQHVASPVDHGS